MFWDKLFRPPEPFATCAQVRAALQSKDAAQRGHALQALIQLAQRDPSIQTEALQIYRKVLAGPAEAWTTVNAIRGLDALLGADQSYSAWQALLADDRPDAQIAMVVWSITDPRLVPRLLELLERRTAVRVRQAILQILGKLGTPGLRPVIEPYLTYPELRPQAIQALGELGDPEAIPRLEPFLKDESEIAQRDERGCVLRVCNLADDAIRRLSRRRNSDSQSRRVPDSKSRPA